MIADFGEAYDPLVTKRSFAHTPPHLAPPESFFSTPGVNGEEYLSFPADIWSLACAIWEIFGNIPLFYTVGGSPDEVLVEHVEVLGKYPTRWWDKWTNRGNWFHDNGQRNTETRHWYGCDPETWNERFPEFLLRARRARKVDIWSLEEQEAFEKMLKDMLIFEPNKRATIEQITQCGWMQEWGLPEYAKMKEALAADTSL